MASRSNIYVIYTGIAVDVAIAVFKFIAAAITGSSAMLSEGIHSGIDATNTTLLLLGNYRGHRPPDRLHPFGYGREIYFWAMIVAIVIFGLGGGVTIYDGIGVLIHPEPLKNPAWNYWVLGVASVFTLVSFAVGIREFRREKRAEEGWWRTFRRSKDPTVYTIVFEDAAAMLGLLLAFLGVFLGHHFNNVYFDGVASILIGITLAVVAVLLTWETRGLLVGEVADPAAVASMKQLAESDPNVERVDRPLTMQLGPHQILLTLDIKFRAGLTVEEIEKTVDRVEKKIQDKHRDVRRIFIEAESLKSADDSAIEDVRLGG
jgi:cation diffusion facilitator family transporter